MPWGISSPGELVPVAVSAVLGSVPPGGGLALSSRRLARCAAASCVGGLHVSRAKGCSIIYGVLKHAGCNQIAFENK